MVFLRHEQMRLKQKQIEFMSAFKERACCGLHLSGHANITSWRASGSETGVTQIKDGSTPTVSCYLGNMVQ